MTRTQRMSRLGLQYLRGRVTDAVPSRELPTDLVAEVRAGATLGSVGVMAYIGGPDPQVLLVRRTVETEPGLCLPVLEIMPGQSVEETAARLFGEYLGVQITLDEERFTILDTVVMTYADGVRTEGAWTGMMLAVGYRMTSDEQMRVKINTTLDGDPSPIEPPPFTSCGWVPLSQIVDGGQFDLPTADLAKVLRRRLSAW